MKTPDEFLEDNGFVAAADIDRPTLISAFISEMERGLEGSESSLMMVPTHVGVGGRIPSGATVAVLDAGGTNFRGGVVSFPPAVSERRNQPMPGTRGEVDSEAFYGAFAEEARRILPLASSKRLGWCFSYPAEATPSLDARLVRWTKNIQAPSIVGDYVGRELLVRLGANGAGGVAVVNDTVATLLAAKATEGSRAYSSYVGFILGTGTNSAYVERTANIKKLPCADPDGRMIVNAESGGFDKIATSAFDAAADAKTADPGRNRFEKLISGAYLGGIGLEIYKGAAKAGLLPKEILSRIVGLGSLSTADFSGFCAMDGDSDGSNPLFSIFSDPVNARMARRLGLPVFERAAVLSAVHLAAFAIKTGEGNDPSAPVAISIDGSTYYKTKAISFAEIVSAELDDLLVRRRNINYEIVPPVDDAPMVGAAVAALTAGSR